ncbi:MAG: efflux RND transporter periplasmic adaptor subunit [Pirellulales bacterium]
MNASDTRSVRDPTIATLKFRDDLVITPDISGDTPYFIIEDPLRGKFYRIGVPEFTFISLLDGRTSVASALGFAAKQLGQQALVEQEGLAICRWLLDCQLAQTDESTLATRLCESAEKTARRRLLERINPLVMKVPLVNPDRLLTAITPRLSWLLSWQFFAVWMATCLYAVYLVAVDWSHLATSAGVILDRDNWLRLALAWALLKLLHELAHGLACKRYGGTVPAAGITFLFFVPLAYVDVTSSWRFRSKWQRMATAAAGMYVEPFAAAIAVILWSNTSAGPAHHVALNVAVTAGFSTLLFNGNPLARFDGYFILSDLLGIPNLYPSSQQYLVALIQRHVLGREPPLSNWSPRKKVMITIYAVAALVWRVVFFLAMALALVGMLAHFGALLAVVLLGFGWGVPGIRIVRQLIRDRSHQPINKRRLATTAAVCLFLVIVGVVLLARPGTVRSPAVVEYSPLTVVRAATPGFVREICVHSGDVVETGQRIAILENRELSTQLADLQLEYRQSVLKERMFHQDEQLGKCQVERANQDAIEKKIAETRDCIAALTVRAPVRGHVFARDIESLAGRYLEAGNEIAIVGAEHTKELLIAVRQDDLDLFLSHLGQRVDVHVRSGIAGPLSARLVKANPCGSTELPHPALAAPVGGPLAVRFKAESQQSSARRGEEYELLVPSFLVKAELQPEQSLRVHAGQRVTVTFPSSAETLAMRILRSSQAWIRGQMAARQAK